MRAQVLLAILFLYAAKGVAHFLGRGNVEQVTDKVVVVQTDRRAFGHRGGGPTRRGIEDFLGGRRVNDR